MIKAAVFLAEPECIITDAKGKPLTKYAIDRRSVVNPANKARVLRCRPVWNEWSTKLALEIDAAIFTEQQLLQSQQLAGRIIGVGDYRPEKGGGFGRFTAAIA